MPQSQDASIEAYKILALSMKPEPQQFSDIMGNAIDVMGSLHRRTRSKADKA